MQMSTERLTARYNWLVQRAEREHPGKEPWVRLDGYAKADQTAASRKRRRAAHLKKKCAMKGAKKAKLDKQRFNLPIAEKGRRQLRGLTFEVTLPDFQEIALEYAYKVIAGLTDSFEQS